MKTEFQLQYPLPKVIAVDVDGTLEVDGAPNTATIAWCRKKKSEGFSLTLWSSRGEQHAKSAAERCGVTDLFDHVLSKPGFIIDDKGWTWIRFTSILTVEQ